MSVDTAAIRVLAGGQEFSDEENAVLRSAADEIDELRREKAATDATARRYREQWLESDVAVICIRDLRTQLAAALRERDEARARGDEFRDKWQEANATRASAERERDEAMAEVKRLTPTKPRYCKHD